MLEIQKLASAAVLAALAGSNLNQVLAATWCSHPRLSQPDRAAVQDLSFGALRFYGLLDGVLKRLLQKPVTDELLRALLIVALYQLQYSRNKSFVVVDHAVAAAKALGKPAAQGLVNAVLRNFLRRREILLAEAATEDAANFNHPPWWIEKLRTQYPGDWQAMLQVANRPPPMTLRVNRRRQSVDNYLRHLAAESVEARALGGEAVVLERPRPVEKVPGFAEGWVSVQDAAAQYAASLMDLADGQRVLDACSAPGGKTGHLLETAEVHLIALDSDAERLKKVAGNLVRLGLSAQLKTADATAPDAWWDGRPFERILIDAPCTGSGVVRRHPDIKWARRPSDIRQFAAQQERLLNALWLTLAHGGKLLYATCAVFREENHEQIAAFLSRHRDAHSLPLGELDTIDGQIIPDDFHDGFFYALLAKH